MDQPAAQSNDRKPEWAMSRKERERQALRAAGIEPRRFPWKIIAGVVVVGGIAAFALPALLAPPAPPPVEAAEPAEQVTKRLLNIDVSTVAPETLVEELKATGSLAPKRMLGLTSQVNGTVSSVMVQVGDKVKAGDLLVQIDSEAYLIQLRQQRATAAATRTQLEQAENQLKRSEGLAARGLTSDATIESERSSINALRANLEALGAGVASAELNIRNATITAPFDGVVSTRSVEPGQIVGAGAPLVEIVDLSNMELTVYVPVSASPRIKPGQRVSLSVDGLGDRKFDGVVEGISPVAAQGTRTVRVLISVANPDGVLRGGMFATGQIVTDETVAAIAVPATAVRSDADGEFVLAITDGKLERVGIETKRTWQSGRLVEVASGLAAGTAYVSGRLEDLEPGMPVTIVEN